MAMGRKRVSVIVLGAGLGWCGCCRAMAADAPVPPTTAPATQPTPEGVLNWRMTVDAAPSRITTNLRDVSPAAVFAEIAKQADVSFDPPPADLDGRAGGGAGGGATLSVQFDREPFWNAVRETCAASGWKVDFDQSASARQHSLTLAAGGGGAKTVECSDGPVRFVALRLARTAAHSYLPPDRDRPAGAGRAGDAFEPGGRLELSIGSMLEPKIPPPIILRQVRLLRAEDENGRSLAVAQPAPRQPLEMAPLAVVSPPRISVLLDPSPPRGKRLALVSGEVELEVPSELAVVQFADTTDIQTQIPLGALGAGGAGAGGSGNTLRIRAPALARAREHVVGLSLQRGKDVGEDAWQKQARAFALPGPRVVLLRQDDSYITDFGGGFSGGDANHEAATYRAPNIVDLPPGLHVYIEYAVTTQTIRAKFEFKDLPLP